MRYLGQACGLGCLEDGCRYLSAGGNVNTCFLNAYGLTCAGHLSVTFEWMLQRAPRRLTEPTPARCFQASSLCIAKHRCLQQSIAHHSLWEYTTVICIYMSARDRYQYSWSLSVFVTALANLTSVGKQVGFNNIFVHVIFLR